MTPFVPFDIMWPGMKFAGNECHRPCCLCFCISLIIFLTKIFTLCLLVLCSTNENVLLNTLQEVWSSQLLENTVIYIEPSKMI